MLISKFRYTIDNYRWSERKVMKGTQNKDKMFYVIRRRNNNVGLFSYVHTALGHMKYAIERDYIPIVDMKNYKTPYTDTLYSENVWEYYFEQPFNEYDLKSIEHSRHIILSSGEPYAEYPDATITYDDNLLNMWRELYQKYVRVNDESQEYIDALKKKIWVGADRVLGVHCRGTDYIRLRPQNHPIQPDVRDVIELASKTMVEQNCAHIYLATEDVYILSQFEEHFKSKLIFPHDIVLPKYEGDKWITEYTCNRENDHKLKGLEYLAQIALLAECNCFIGGQCGGTYSALLMTKGFEWKYIYNLGVY